MLVTYAMQVFRVLGSIPWFRGLDVTSSHLGISVTFSGFWVYKIRLGLSAQGASAGAA